MDDPVEADRLRAAASLVIEAVHPVPHEQPEERERADSHSAEEVPGDDGG